MNLFTLLPLSLEITPFNVDCPCIACHEKSLAKEKNKNLETNDPEADDKPTSSDARDSLTDAPSSIGFKMNIDQLLSSQAIYSSGNNRLSNSYRMQRPLTDYLLTPSAVDGLFSDNVGPSSSLGLSYTNTGPFTACPRKYDAEDNDYYMSNTKPSDGPSIHNPEPEVVLVERRRKNRRKLLQVFCDVCWTEYKRERKCSNCGHIRCSACRRQQKNVDPNETAEQGRLNGKQSPVLKARRKVAVVNRRCREIARSNRKLQINADFGRLRCRYCDIEFENKDVCNGCEARRKTAAVCYKPDDDDQKQLRHSAEHGGGLAHNAETFNDSAEIDEDEVQKADKGKGKERAVATASEPNDALYKDSPGRVGMSQVRSFLPPRVHMPPPALPRFSSNRPPWSVPAHSVTSHIDYVRPPSPTSTITIPLDFKSFGKGNYSLV